MNGPEAVTLIGPLYRIDGESTFCSPLVLWEITAGQQRTLSDDWGTACLAFDTMGPDEKDVDPDVTGEYGNTIDPDHANLYAMITPHWPQRHGRFAVLKGDMIHQVAVTIASLLGGDEVVRGAAEGVREFNDLTQLLWCPNFDESENFLIWPGVLVDCPSLQLTRRPEPGSTPTIWHTLGGSWICCMVEHAEHCSGPLDNFTREDVLTSIFAGELSLNQLASPALGDRRHD